MYQDHHPTSHPHPPKKHHKKPQQPHLTQTRRQLGRPLPVCQTFDGACRRVVMENVTDVTPEGDSRVVGRVPGVQLLEVEEWQLRAVHDWKKEKTQFAAMFRSTNLLLPHIDESPIFLYFLCFSLLVSFFLPLLSYCPSLFNAFVLFLLFVSCTASIYNCYHSHIVVKKWTTA